ncbi:Dynein heavy chain 3, axonemal, partial [Nowakowskiella sp. JEL0078]
LKNQNPNVEVASRPLSPESRKKKMYLPLNPIGPLQICLNEELDPYDTESQNISKQLAPDQRYFYYIRRGIPDEDVAPIEEKTINSIEKRIPVNLLGSEKLQHTRLALLEEVHENFKIALKQSIIEYVLLDPKEQQRLRIPQVSSIYEPRIVRAPVPWHENLNNVKNHITNNLFITNPIMLELLRIYSQFESSRLFDMSLFASSVLPMTIDDFQTILKNQCLTFKNKLLKEWLPVVANMFFTTKEQWYNVIAGSCLDPDLGYIKLDSFFKSVSAIMSNQLWSLVVHSLEDFENFFSKFANFNSDISVFTVRLTISGAQVKFDPPLADLESMIISILEEMVSAVHEIPRIETKLFTSLQGEPLFLSAMNVDDDRIAEGRNVRSIVSKNTFAPQKHLQSYDKYKAVLTHKAEKRIDEFLRERHELEDYEV